MVAAQADASDKKRAFFVQKGKGYIMNSSTSSKINHVVMANKQSSFTDKTHEIAFTSSISEL